MSRVILVMVGGSIGALARYGLGWHITRTWGTGFPWDTLVINLSGCFLIGLAFTFGDRNILSPSARLALVTGFLGAYTTFSTYGLETINFARGGLGGTALMNILVNNFGGLLLVGAGLWTGRMLLGAG